MKWDLESWASPHQFLIQAAYDMLPSPSNFHTRGRAESPPRVPIKEPLSTSSPAALWNLKKVNITRGMTKSLRQSLKPSAQDLSGQSSSCLWMKVYDAEIPETANDSTNVPEDVSGGISRCIHTAWDTLKFSYKWKSWWRVYIWRLGLSMHGSENESETISDYETEKESHPKECVGRREKIMGKQTVMWQMSIFNPSFFQSSTLSAVLETL